MHSRSPVCLVLWRLTGMPQNVCVGDIDLGFGLLGFQAALNERLVARFGHAQTYGLYSQHTFLPFQKRCSSSIGWNADPLELLPSQRPPTVPDRLHFLKIGTT